MESKRRRRAGGGGSKRWGRDILMQILSNREINAQSKRDRDTEKKIHREREPERIKVVM